MKFVIKADFPHPLPDEIDLAAQKTMYGGKNLSAGDRIYLFAANASERPGLIARGIVTHAKALPKKPGVERQTPRLDLTIMIEASSSDHIGRAQLHGFTDWQDGRPQTELNFKLYRQATSKIVGISDEVAAYLDGFFR